MKLPVNLANNIFKIKIIGYDEQVSRVKGKTEFLVFPDRILVGTIQPAGDKSASLFPDGQMSDGAMILHTNSRVYTYNSAESNILVQNNWFTFDDKFLTLDYGIWWSNGASLEIRDATIQTFIRYKGEVWKLTKSQNWEDHIQSNVNRYGLVKYVNVNDD